MSALKKLMDARLKLQSTELKKSGHNKFAGYSYFELGDFLPTVNNIFAEVGLCGLISFGTELATLTITDLDSGESVAITSPMSTAALKGCHEVQNLGAVETYIRRYLWVTALEIVEHDALDMTVGHKENKPGAETIEAIRNAVSYTIVSPDGTPIAKEDTQDGAIQAYNNIADKLMRSAKLSDTEKLDKIKKLWDSNNAFFNSIGVPEKMKMTVVNADRIKNLSKSIEDAKWT